MLGCSTTVCPNCKHQFATCCPSAATEPPPPCRRRSIVLTSGGGIIAANAIAPISPQISPSVPLSFLLPPPQQPPPPPLDHSVDVERLAATVRSLRLSGFYYENLTFDKSDELLKDTKVGTFLVRDSSDPRYLFSLSVQTDRGPVSVRLFYGGGFFRLDAQAHFQEAMPFFSGVLELVQYYVKRRKDGQVWLDPQGKCVSSIMLDKPLRKEGKPPTLKHLARLAINKQLGENSAKKVLKLELPSSLGQYLLEYPYSL